MAACALRGLATEVLTASGSPDRRAREALRGIGGAPVDKAHNPAVSSNCQGTARIFHSTLSSSILATDGRRARQRAYPEMSISVPFKHDHDAFGPETIALLAAALEDTLRALGLADRNDPAVTRVAKTIIELARLGERDPIRLRNLALASFRAAGSPFSPSPTR